MSAEIEVEPLSAQSSKTLLLISGPRIVVNHWVPIVHSLVRCREEGVVQSLLAPSQVLPNQIPNHLKRLA